MPTAAELQAAEQTLRDKLRTLRKLTGKAGRDPEAKRKADADRRRKQTIEAQEIAPLPGVANPRRRKLALKSFRKFCETYFKSRFTRPWSSDHRSVIATIDRAITGGGFFCLAMPRGTGKTSLCEIACLYAVLTGRHRFVLLVGATKAASVEMFDSIKIELEENDLFCADFPKEVRPFALLGGSARRCEGQRYEGNRTHIGWLAAQVVFPTIPGSVAPAAIIRVAGLTGRIRGAKASTPSGEQIRPSLMIIDDPQTDGSAKSPLQTQRREEVIKGTLLGAKQQGQSLTVLMPVTVIAREDLADRFLDAKRHPLWKSARHKMLYSMPDNLDLWEQYAALLGDDLAAGGDGSPAGKFYRKNRKAMDLGANAAWKHNYDDDEISAVEHAMRWYLFNRAAFFAECQNEPEDTRPMRCALTPDLVAGKLSQLPRGTVPQHCQYVAAYVDVHSRVLYHCITAIAADFAGAVIDYGTYPDQPEAYFAQATSPVAMEHLLPGLVEDAWILAGLTALSADLLGRTYRRQDGAEMRIGKLLIDSKWGEKTRLVKQFCARHPQAGSVVMPAQGIGLGASSKPFEEYRPEPGALAGLSWRIPPPKDGVRTVTIDTNFWKSLVAGRIALPPGTPGGWELFGTSPRQHALFADHCCAEEPVETTAKGRTVDEWKWKPGRPDNHYFDCVVGTGVAGNMLGAQPAGMAPLILKRKKPRRRAARYIDL